MNMTQGMLEIMIGKYLDGEITPSEQRLLEAELDRDPQAKELLAQLREMHERCGEAVVSELLGRSEEVFDKYQKLMEEVLDKYQKQMHELRKSLEDLEERQGEILDRICGQRDEKEPKEGEESARPRGQDGQGV